MFKKIIDDYIVVESLPINIEKGKTYAIAQSNPNSYTHNYFKYPCKFIPEIPRWAMKKYASDESKLIFDPFSGSGTTLLEGIINNHSSYGTEIDDIAKLLIKVKTTPLSSKLINEAEKKLGDVLKGGNNDKVIPTIAQINNIEHWFSEDNILKLGRMRTIIEEIENTDIKDFFKVCFVSIIRKCSYADDISPKPYVSSRIKKVPAEPIDEFSNIFTKYITSMKELSKLNLIKRASIVDGDALNVSLNFQVDLIITSPPYINAFDYGRTLRLENLWLGYLSEEELRYKKRKYVGTEKIKIADEEANLEILKSSSLLKSYFDNIITRDKKRAMVVKRFFEDMRTNLFEMKKILKHDGHYCIVIGNSNIRDVEIESWKVIRDIAIKVGFSEVTHYSYIIQNPYIRIPRGGRGGKINKDYVLVLKKMK